MNERDYRQRRNYSPKLRLVIWRILKRCDRVLLIIWQILVAALVDSKIGAAGIERHMCDMNDRPGISASILILVDQEIDGLPQIIDDLPKYVGFIRDIIKCADQPFHVVVTNSCELAGCLLFLTGHGTVWWQKFDHEASATIESIR